MILCHMRQLWKYLCFINQTSSLTYLVNLTTKLVLSHYASYSQTKTLSRDQIKKKKMGRTPSFANRPPPLPPTSTTPQPLGFGTQCPIFFRHLNFKANMLFPLKRALILRKICFTGWSCPPNFIFIFLCLLRVSWCSDHFKILLNKKRSKMGH